MQNYLIYISIFLFQLTVFSQETKLISNKILEQYLVDRKLDKDNTVNGKISVADLNSIEKIDLFGKGLAELNELQLFPNLAYLRVENNKLTKLDISNNPKLVILNAINNQLQKIDISENKNIETVILLNNKELTDFVASDNTRLTTLNLSGCKLNTINVSGITSLENLDLFGNLLTNIDLGNNKVLKILNLGMNELISELNLSNNVNLMSLNIDSLRMNAIDLSSNSELMSLSAIGTYIKALDLSNNTNLMDIELGHNTSLQTIDLYNIAESLPKRFVAPKLYNLSCISIKNIEKAKKHAKDYSWKIPIDRLSEICVN